MLRVFIFLSFTVLVGGMTSCSTLKTTPTAQTKEVEQPEPLTRYSKEPNLAPISDREYRKMTRQRMEDESDLQAGAGSLWVMEGQTSYLFAQNKQRRTGDPTQIKIEGPALKQLEMKVTSIQDLLSQLEEQKKQAELEQKRIEDQKNKAQQDKLRLAAIKEEKAKIKESKLAGKDATDEQIQKMAEENVNKRMPSSTMENSKDKQAANVEKKEEKPDLKDIEFIPSRIIEKTPDGFYRITGQQTLTIKKRPYKVIATGLVRAEDYDDQAISSSKMFDAQYDILHIKKVESY